MDSLAWNYKQLDNNEGKHFENKTVKAFFKALLIVCREGEFKGKLQHNIQSLQKPSLTISILIKFSFLSSSMFVLVTATRFEPATT